MSQHRSYASSNHRLSFNKMNSHCHSSHGTPTSSGLDGKPGPTDVDPLNLHSFGNVRNVNPGFLNELDIAALSSGRDATGPTDDRSGFAGLEVNRLYQFYTDRDGPWNPQKSRVRDHSEVLPPSFNWFRDTTVPSECETSIGPGNLQSDSGYGSQARQSVGQPSIYGDVDRTPESLLAQLPAFQISHGSGRGHTQVSDVDHSRNSWNQGSLVPADVVTTNNTHNYACQYCPKTFRSQSDHKKHTARHVKPHRCPEVGCSKATEGFGTANDLERHRRSVHHKGGTRYRCHHGACLSKVKDWPRADNFRSHLKKIHDIRLDADDSLGDYIYSPPNPEVLSNVGVAPELIPPADHGSPAPMGWTRLGLDTHVHLSDSGKASEEFPLDPPQTSLQPGLDTRLLNVDGFADYDASSLRSIRTSHNPLEPERVHDQGFKDSTKAMSDEYHREVDRIKSVLDLPSGDNLGYIRPDDLSTRMLNSSSVDSADRDNGAEVIANSDHGDNYDGTFEDDNRSEDDFNIKSPTSPCVPSKEAPSGDESRLPPVTDSTKRLQGQHQGQPGSERLSETSSGLDDTIKRGTPGALDQTFQSSPEDMDDVDLDEPEVEFKKLMAKLDNSQLEKLLRDQGFVKPKASQTKPKKLTAVQDSSSRSTVTCPEPECGKTFQRPCEMKKHLKRHIKPYGCTQCKKRFGSKNDWKRHENSQHFQHEIWKCDEKLKALLIEPCNKICHRRETFKQHLQTHHEIDGPKLEEKLDKCRIGRLGEARFWCGFCKDVIEIESKQSGLDACNGRYDHIDDHYSGRNGAAKKDASEWQYGDSDQSELDFKAPRSRSGDRKDGSSAEMKTVPASRAPELKKRSRHGAGPMPKKRAKVSPPTDLLIWTCCKCSIPLSVANVASCINNCDHERCDNCTIEQVQPMDDDEVLA